ncbi:MAG: Transcriptional regulator, AsnC family [uncultured Craurococcus sp.]|uniref:Transcriptional regulator, AsnC family n=1 Tax=uncultured Craurococcus sp. TaxID=1135998 RepID=A0A6J4GZX5_9PROT|nr:MAG: Transcriptional regulator, AsnC family [uncultured Craurococcus sp.]
MFCGESADNSMQTLDETDRAILRLLRADGRMSNADLAEAVGLSASACLRRVRLLEHRGIIRGYTALIEEAAPRDLVVVIVQITLDRQTDDHLKRFEEAVRRCPEVRECYLMTGIADYLLRVEARDAADYERIHKEALSRMPGVARIQSSFAIRTVIRGAT